MRTLLLAIIISIAGLGSCNQVQAAIGVVSEHKGSNCGIERNKQKIAGEKGAGVESMDIYTTGACVSSITFKDDTKVRVNENSRLLIDDFVFDPKASDAGKLALKVGAGTVRYASGQIAKNNPQQVNIKTPTAAIAVRGTDFTMTVDESGGSLVVLLPSCKDESEVKKYELEENRCKVGKIEVSTLNGTVSLDKAFEATFVISASIPPTPPKIINTVESKINNNLILVRPIEIQQAIKDQQKSKYEKDKDALELEAAAALAQAVKQTQDQEQARILQMQRAAAAAGCDSSKNVCVVWQNPDAATIQNRGQGIAFRSNNDNYAEVKTTGADSNTLVSITHNDSPASYMIGDAGAVSNTVTIKQNVGMVKVK
jgi:hypothetical protein